MNPPATPERPRISLPDLLLGVGVIALGAFFLIGTLNLEVVVTYARVGPRFFPLLVSIGLLAVGALLTIDALRGGRAEPAAEEDADPDAPPNYKAVGWISLGILLQALLMNLAGFIIASTLLFWCVARGFRSTRPLRDLAIAIVLSVLVYFAFTAGLNLTLPAGILQGVL